MPIITRLLSPHYHQCRLASTSTIQGWTTSVTKTGKHVFMKIDEGNGKEPVQLIADKELIKDQKVNVGSAITATGSIQKSHGSQQETEFVAEQLKVVGSDSNPRYDLGTDQLRKNLFLRARNSKFAAFLRARSAIFRETHEYFMNNDFIHIDTPKLTENDCEGGGEVFDVVSDAEEYRRLGSEYQKMHLTVSSQLHLEAMVSRLGKVYTLGPAFRAEKQLSHTHLSEFHMLEAEIAFLEKTSDLCDVIESYVTHMIQFVRSSPVIQSSLKTMETQPEINTPSDRFARITFEEAVEILKSAGESVTSKGGLSRKNELFLVKAHDDQPVFVTDFPVKHKPFYMARDGDNTLSFDLLVPGVGELAGGSVREHNLKDLEQRCQIDWYLELRRRGQPPTGGFGIGFERLLQYLMGVHHIRDTIAFPRWYRQVKCDPFTMVKVKNRYYVVRMLTNDGSQPTPHKSTIFREFMKLCTEMFGDFGYSILKISLSIRVIDEDVIVLRVAESGNKFFGAILPCVHKLDKQPMVLQTIFIGRSMRSCEKRLLKTRRDELHAALGKCSSQATRQPILDALQRICGQSARIFTDEQRKDQGF